jgi:hypothetical protein
MSFLARPEKQSGRRAPLFHFGALIAVSPDQILVSICTSMIGSILAAIASSRVAISPTSLYIWSFDRACGYNLNFA